MEVLEHTFVRADFRVLMATNLEQAVSAAQTETPDLVVCDSEIKDVNRKNLQEQMPDSLDWKTLPFIFLREFGPGQEISGSLDLDQYFNKPFDPIGLATLSERTLAYREYLANSPDTQGRSSLTERRAMHREVLREIHRIRRYGGQMSLCLLEVMQPPTQKILNAPVAEPVVFDRVAQLIPDFVRSVDIIIRLNRKQFMWVMPATDAAGARQALRRLAKAIEAIPVVELRSSLTIRAGLATAPDDSLDYEELVEIARQELAERPVEQAQPDAQQAATT